MFALTETVVEYYNMHIEVNASVFVRICGVHDFVKMASDDIVEEDKQEKKNTCHILTKKKQNARRKE